MFPLTRRFLAFAIAAGAAHSTDLFSLVREGDTQKILAALKAGSEPDARDRFGTTPLMYACAFGSSADVELLLRAGAEVNTTTAEGFTALMWATADPEKVRLLLDAGAVVKAQSRTGMTALLSAALRENAQVFRMLIAAGANLGAHTTLIPNTPIRVGLQQLAYTTNESTLRSLLRELKQEPPDAKSLVALPGSSPLAGYFVSTGFSMRPRARAGVADGLRALLEIRGVDPNTDARQLARTLPPVALAASFSDGDAVELLLGKGADPNRSGTEGVTPLMMAVSAEDPDVRTVRLLVEAGAQLNVKDSKGRTALDWALMQGESDVSEWLRQHGGARGDWKPPSPPPVINEPRAPQEALGRALERLLNSGQVFHKQAGCISCHHQSLPAVAVQIAIRRGIPIDAGLSKHGNEATIAMWGPGRESFLAGNCSIFGFLGNVSYGLWSLAEAGAAANEITDAAVSCLASLQWPDGRWEGADMRPPLAGRTPFVYTALAIRALRIYSPPAQRNLAEQKIRRARTYLESARPKDTQGEAFRLLGLVWSGAGAATIKGAAKQLAGLQQENGGWPQLPKMTPDAYATGQAVYALSVSGTVAGSAVFQRAIRFLLRTQLEDGTWYVPSRTLGFQPYMETGFPHGRDQFISAAATAWGAIGVGISSR